MNAKDQDILQALGYESVAWLWSINQPTSHRGEDLLLAISDGDYRTLRQIMDEPETHAMFADSEAMFAAFMLTCAMQADARCWNEVRDHGYGLETQFREPVFDEKGRFVGMHPKQTRLGDWVGAFCSMERVVELADDMDWSVFHMPWDRKYTIGCEWHLGGTCEDEGWARLWRAHYKQAMDERRAAKAKGDAWQNDVVGIPHVFYMLDEWSSRSKKNMEKEAAGRGWKRLDAMIMTWAQEGYWPAQTKDLWERMIQAPPYVNTSQVDPQKAVRTVERMIKVVAGTRGEPLEELMGQVDNLQGMIKNGSHVPAAALINLGAPLEVGGVDIGEMILSMALVGKGVSHVVWDAWIGRVEKEGSQAWDRVPEFVRRMSVGDIRAKTQKDAPFKEMLKMAISTQARAVKPVARF